VKGTMTEKKKGKENHTFPVKKAYLSTGAIAAAQQDKEEEEE